MSIRNLTQFWLWSIRQLFQFSNQSSVWVHCHDSTTLVPGIISKLLKPRIQLVYDSHESAVDSIGENFGIILVIITYLIEIIALRLTNVVITVSPLQKQVLAFRYGPFLDKVVLVRNLPRRDELEGYQLDKGREILDRLSISKETIVIVYATYLGVNRGLPELLEAWKRKDRNDLFLIIAGDGPLAPMLEETELRNFCFLGYLEAPLYYSLMRNCDLGLSLIDPQSNLNKKIGYPNKLTEYLACEVIPLTTRLQNFSKEFKQGLALPIEEISETELLRVFNSLDIDEIRHLRQKKTGKIRSEYLWDKDVSKLLSIYGITDI